MYYAVQYKFMKYIVLECTLTSKGICMHHLINVATVL